MSHTMSTYKFANNIMSKPILVSSCCNIVFSTQIPSHLSRNFQYSGKFLRIYAPICSGDLTRRRGSSYDGYRICDVDNNGSSNSRVFSVVNCNKRANLSIRPFASLPVLEQTPKGKNSKEHGETLTLPQKFVGAFPDRCQPYFKLSRVDRPIGTWLLFWPSVWGLAAASGGLPDLKLLALFGAGAFVMRGAGCTVNDMWDRHIDPKVRRTSERPLASRQLRMRHATAWLGGQLSIAFGILLHLNPSCFLISCGALGLVCLYPLAKRVTYWPQAVLGLTFNTGVLIGFAAALPTETGFFDVPYLDVTCLSLYTAGILWTLIYDTIYAHQDLQDDTLLGLGSTARRFGDNTKLWLSGFSTAMISTLTLAGVASDMTWPYYLGLGGVTAHLVWQISTLNIKDAANCGHRFTSNRHIGWLILLSMLTSYWMKDEDKQNICSIKAAVEVTDSLPVSKYAASLTSNSI